MLRGLLAVACGGAWLLIAGTATANEPSYYKVRMTTGKLAVRVEPTTAATRVAMLENGAGPIEVIETRMVEGTRWGKILLEDINAWVAMEFLEPIKLASLDDSGAPVGLVCQGTQPFWSLKFARADRADFSTPSATGKPEHVITGMAPTGWNRPWPLAVALAGPEGEVTALLRPAACQDSLTNRAFGWTIDLITRGDGGPAAISGCCNLPFSPRGA